MKKLLKYSLTLAFLFLLLQISFASVETKGKSQGTLQVGQDQQQQTEAAKPSDEPAEEYMGGVSGEEESQQGEEESQTDSLIDDSVSKYNFILYFLYKFKYEEEDI